MTCRFTRASCLVLSLLFLSPASSFADEHGTHGGLHWVMERDQLWSVDSSDAGDAPNFFSFVRIITVSGGEGPILQLSCQATSRGDQMLQAGIKLDPENTYEQAPKEHLRLLEMSGKLTVGGDRKSERFQYHPDSSKITPRNRTVPKRLFNAVVRGDPVQLKVRNKTYDLAVPGVDPVFTMFAKTCPVTNGGTFDESIFENAKGMRTEATATD